MEDAGDTDCGFGDVIENEVMFDVLASAAGKQCLVGFADMGAVLQKPETVLQFCRVSLHLQLTPGFLGVLQDIRNILFG